MLRKCGRDISEQGFDPSRWTRSVTIVFVASVALTVGGTRVASAATTVTPVETGTVAVNAGPDAWDSETADGEVSLSAAGATWSGASSTSWQWYDCVDTHPAATGTVPSDCTPANGSGATTSSSFYPNQADAGYYVIAAQTASGGSGNSTTAYSTTVGPINAVWDGDFNSQSGENVAGAWADGATTTYSMPWSTASSEVQESDPNNEAGETDYVETNDHSLYWTGSVGVPSGGGTVWAYTWYGGIYGKSDEVASCWSKYDNEGIPATSGEQFAVNGYASKTSAAPDNTVGELQVWWINASCARISDSVVGKYTANNVATTLSSTVTAPAGATQMIVAYGMDQNGTSPAGLYNFVMWLHSIYVHPIR